MRFVTRLLRRRTRKLAAGLIVELFHSQLFKVRMQMFIVLANRKAGIIQRSFRAIVMRNRIRLMVFVDIFTRREDEMIASASKKKSTPPPRVPVELREKLILQWCRR